MPSEFGSKNRIKHCDDNTPKGVKKETGYALKIKILRRLSTSELKREISEHINLARCNKHIISPFFHEVVALARITEKPPVWIVLR